MKHRIESLLQAGKDGEAIALAEKANLVCRGAAFIAWDDAARDLSASTRGLPAAGSASQVGFLLGPPRLTEQSGCWRKTSEIFGRFGICLAWMLPRRSGQRLLRCDEPGTLQKLLRQPRHRPGTSMDCKIAEGMVTFFESYEQEPKKCWTKTLFFQLSWGIPPLLDSSAAHRSRRHQSAR
jgi:hypothetical protein